jgi:hypothetical protein
LPSRAFTPSAKARKKFSICESVPAPGNVDTTASFLGGGALGGGGGSPWKKLRKSATFNGKRSAEATPGIGESVDANAQLSSMWFTSFMVEPLRKKWGGWYRLQGRSVTNGPEKCFSDTVAKS